MPSLDAARTIRGAVAGALSAGVWAAQQPLDQRVFGVPYADTELLGKLVTRGRTWPLVGLGLHLANGALFGGVYAAVAPRLPLPSRLRGPVAGLAEHVALWPLLPVIERMHPARGDLPGLSGDPRAFAQATWRHLLFGVLLGEIERRLNDPDDEDPAADHHVVSPNGHGDLQHVVSGTGRA